MKWDRLRLFNIVAQTRNITEASYILHISQSALSRQMKALENELGVKLFLRNSDGISLTKAGMRLSSSVQVLASDISKTHNQILEDISFMIREGEICGLLGPNGVGKSTIFNLITGLLKPDFGEIEINQKKVKIGRAHV